MFTNVRWNEKNDVIIVCFPILDEMKEWRHNLLFTNNEMKIDIMFPNIRWNEKNDVIIVCFPIFDETKRMTT